LSGVDLANFWIGLVALGVGWNFMFIGGTTLLTTTYRPEERAKVQAVNDFCVFGSVATAALSSGVLHAVFGWDGVNLGIALPILIAFSAAFWLRLRGSTAPAQ
jgi:MFS family permease